jgi:restriction system protein
MALPSTRSKPEFLDRLLTAWPWWHVIIAVAGYAGLFVFQASVTSPILRPMWWTFPPFWLAFWIMIAAFAFVHQKRRGDLLETQTGLDSLRTMDWKAFERLVAEVYQRQGYKVEYQFDMGPDGGVDVRLRKDGKLTLVQCKQWQNALVGVGVVREMFGLMHHENADAAVITTTSRFTPEAEAFAEGKPITLIGGPKLWSMVRDVQRAPSPEVMEALPEIPAAPTTEAESPACPHCGGAMRRKINGTTQQPFWGCFRFPQCKGSVSI